jgi:2-polyprenyl-6-methoxyphenol hydroxylase-like FAD-dependent oxidoreductase
MSLKERTEVLVVGAGPVGLLSAILLAEAGLEVEVIDTEARTAARSYACALHPRSLKLLERLGLAQPVIEAGRRVEKMAFYEGNSRVAEVHIAKLGGPFPFLLILPQNAFEGLLEAKLSRAGVNVHWNHRLDSFLNGEESVTAEVEELGGTMTGYIVPHWETVVRKRRTVQAQFLVGADGQNSKVRRRLGFHMERAEAASFFAAYEFETAGGQETVDEVRVVLDDSTTNVLWPLADNRCRWTFQLQKSLASSEFPEKERRAVRVAQKVVDEQIRQYVERVARVRAPWFDAGVKEISWCTEVVFTPQFARNFGQGRCWLVGDASHQTGPVGVQSMNVGLLEAETLAGLLQKVLRQDTPLSTLQTYEQGRINEWRQLLGLATGFNPGSADNAWVRQHWPRILPCLPASGEDLARLAGQLGVQAVSTVKTTEAG